MICVTPWQIATLTTLGLKVNQYHSDASKVLGCDVRRHLAECKSLTSFRMLSIYQIWLNWKNWFLPV